MREENSREGAKPRRALDKLFSGKKNSYRFFLKFETQPLVILRAFASSRENYPIQNLQAYASSREINNRRFA